jgi:hypothetical protein
VADLQPDVNESAEFYSVYLRIQNTSENPLTITHIRFDWPYYGGSTRMRLKEIRFSDFTDWTANCGAGTTCIWQGWSGSESYETISICDDCSEHFSGVQSDLQLDPNILKYLKFVFWDPLNNGTYSARITFDDTCFIETAQTILVISE